MKSNEITVGNEYAIDQYGFTDVYQMSTARLVRVTVITAPKAGKVHVRFQSESRQDDVISTRKVVAPWGEYAKAFNQQRAYQMDSKNRTIAAAESIPTFLPEGTPLPHWCDGRIYNDGSYSRDGKVTVTELANLLALAYSHGQQNAGA